MLYHVCTTGGLRERKKEKTRNALVKAALALFVEQGYEHTTIREITDVVGVSERTFFRYFPGKEELVLSLIALAMELFLEELAAAPAGQPPLPTLRDALCRALGRLQDEWPGMDGGVQYATIVRLIEATPSLLATQMAMIQRENVRVVRAVAARYDVDPRTDPRPRLLAAGFGAVMAVATEQWRGDGEVSDLIEQVHRNVDALLPALTDWG